MLGGGRGLVALVALASLGAVIGGRAQDVLYALAIAAPLSLIASLLHGAAIYALIGEIISVLGFLALGGHVGGPFILLAVGIGIGGIVYAPRARRRLTPRYRAALAGMVATLIIAAQVQTAGLGAPAAGQEDVITLGLQGVWMLLAIAICAGWPRRRTFAAGLDRLGLERPTLSQIAAAVGIAAGLVLVCNGIGAALEVVFQANGWSATSDAEVRTVFAGLMSPFGVLVIAITAGIVEEIFVRGLLQPRFGILLPAAFFTALHAGQYRLDAMLPLFVLAVALGLVRRRWHTTAAIIVHGAYNAMIGALLLAGAT